MAIDVIEYNKAVQKFRSKVIIGLKAGAAQFTHGKSSSFITRGNHTEKKLVISIGSKIRKSAGLPESISFQFERHGIFVAKGVGRGRGIANPGTAREWINPVIEQNAPLLADKIAEINANHVINLRQ